MINHTQSEKWIAHVAHRLREASDVGLLKPSYTDPLTCTVFTPEHVAPADLENVHPCTSLREFGETRGVSSGTWSRREDLMQEASEWMIEEFGHVAGATLLCEAGYSKIGDKSLESEPHVNFSGNPFFYRRLRESEAEEVARTLRKSRSRRTVGIVGSASEHELPSLPATPLLFLCDAFDGDSLAVLKLL